MADLAGTKGITMPSFDPRILRDEDWGKALSIIGPVAHLVHPDLVIAPAGKQEPYLYRWHIVPRNVTGCNVYFHIQVASDPERPLHDHPWDSTSVILTGGYDEYLSGPDLIHRTPRLFRRVPGDVIYRPAEIAHRLVLPKHVPYSMSLFTTGPVRRDWGFWFPDGWRSHKQVVEDEDGVSTFKENKT